MQWIQYSLFRAQKWKEFDFYWQKLLDDAKKLLALWDYEIHFIAGVSITCYNLRRQNHTNILYRIMIQIVLDNR